LLSFSLPQRIETPVPGGSPSSDARLEQFVRPEHPVDTDALNRRMAMVEIRVAVPDAGTAHGLLRRLASVFGRSAIAFDGTHNEVSVKSEWESRSVVGVIEAVQDWLVSDHIESVRLSIGESSYTLYGQTGRLSA
jgi:hypothetical protein